MKAMHPAFRSTLLLGAIAIAIAGSVAAISASLAQAEPPTVRTTVCEQMSNNATGSRLPGSIETFMNAQLVAGRTELVVVNAGTKVIACSW